MTVGELIARLGALVAEREDAADWGVDVETGEGEQQSVDDLSVLRGAVGAPCVLISLEW